ncbi:hypothetical protein T11_2336 [Trichinella zimbabwensis]|uniref:Uncharacterized protein n=1 Tax=Trichinella zimbabwensis TaxID=268475 RepID=A0A0V1GS50_9BILA|nr:hypothetical protein T11_2336 [Trichinella zimbabwensis]
MASKVRTMPILMCRKVATLKLSWNEARMLAIYDVFDEVA